MKQPIKTTEAIFPMPVLLIATYNEDGTIDVMNAAWGTMLERDRVALNLTETHKTVENIKRLSVEPYTREDICDLIVKFLEDHGTRISEEESFRKELQETVVSLDIMCVKEAAAAVEELVFYADFSGFVPAVDACSLKLLTESRKKGRVRRDVK